MTTHDLPRWLLVEDIREMLGGVVGLRTIQAMAARGEIPGARKIGRRWAFQRQPVIAWVEGGHSADVIELERRRSQK